MFRAFHPGRPTHDLVVCLAITNPLLSYYFPPYLFIFKLNLLFSEFLLGQTVRPESKLPVSQNYQTFHLPVPQPFTLSNKTFIFMSPLLSASFPFPFTGCICVLLRVHPSSHAY